MIACLLILLLRLFLCASKLLSFSLLLLLFSFIHKPSHWSTPSGSPSSCHCKRLFGAWKGLIFPPNWACTLKFPAKTVMWPWRNSNKRAQARIHSCSPVCSVLHLLTAVCLRPYLLCVFDPSFLLLSAHETRTISRRRKAKKVELVCLGSGLFCLLRWVPYSIASLILYSTIMNSVKDRICFLNIQVMLQLAVGCLQGSYIAASHLLYLLGKFLAGPLSIPKSCIIEVVALFMDVVLYQPA